MGRAVNDMAALEFRKIDLGQFGNLFRQKPAQLTDQELLSMDFILHRAWAYLKEGHKVFTPNGLWNFKDLSGLHAKVRDEMNRRGFIHTIKDELDERISPPSDSPESIPANEKNASGNEDLTKGLVSGKEVEDFPNLVFNEDDAVKFFRTGRANASTT